MAPVVVAQVGKQCVLLGVTVEAAAEAHGCIRPKQRGQGASRRRCSRPTARMAASQIQFYRSTSRRPPLDDGQIVAVTAQDMLLPYFQFGQEGGVKHGSEGPRTRALLP